MSPTLYDPRLVPIRRADPVTNSTSSLTPTPEGSTLVTNTPSGQSSSTPAPTSSGSSSKGINSSRTSGSSTSASTSSSSSVASQSSAFSSSAASSSGSSYFSTASSSPSSAISPVTSPSSSRSPSPSVNTVSSSSSPSTPLASPTTNTGDTISLTTPSFIAPSSSSGIATIPLTTPAATSSSSSLLSPASSASTPRSSSGALAASSLGFWSNKSAVAGTFTAVAIVVLALIAGVLVWRRRRAPFLRNSNYSEKYLVSQPVQRSPSVASGVSSQNLFRGPSDVFANRDSPNPSYDPFISAAAQRTLYSGNASLPEITYSYAQDVNNQYPYYGDEPSNNIPLPPSGVNSSIPNAGSRNPYLQNPFEPAVVPAQNPFDSVYNTQSLVEPGASTARAPSQATYEFGRISNAYPPSLDDSFYGTTSMEGRAI